MQLIVGGLGSMASQFV